jgi:hypothetical protein
LFECADGGTGKWHVEQGSAFESGPGAAVSPWFTWARWAPVAAAPWPASAGGEALTRFAPSASSQPAEATGVRPAVPWQLEQVRFATSRAPLMWSAASTEALL